MAARSETLGSRARGGGGGAALPSALGAVAVMAVAAALLFWVLQRQMEVSAAAFHLPPEVLAELELSLVDQKRLAELDPGAAESYRERFDELGRTVGRLRIVEQSRAQLVRRHELLLLALLTASVALATGWYVARHSRYGPRLERLRSGLAELAEGGGPVEIGDRGRDTLGRIARMVEAASRTLSRERRRRRSLENLSRWQRAARRHAHEMRTPLTGARLGLERLRGLADETGEERREIIETIGHLEDELGRLASFAERFATFARLPEPEPVRQDVSGLAADFVAGYADAWPGVELRLGAAPPVEAEVDRDMIRQVLANLCDNSARALAGRPGAVEIAVEPRPTEVRVTVTDDGPGIADEARRRLFEPWAGARGEGMGLGLAIARKIALDHGGDLELLASSSSGAAFTLTLPRPLAP